MSSIKNQDTPDCKNIWREYRRLRDKKIEIDQKYRDESGDYSVSERLTAYRDLKTKAEDFQDKHFYRFKEFMEKLEKRLDKFQKTIESSDNYNIILNKYIADFESNQRYLDQKGIEKFAKMFFEWNFIKSIFEKNQSEIEDNEYLIANIIFTKFLNSNQNKDQPIYLGSFLDPLKKNFFLSRLNNGNYITDNVGTFAFLRTAVESLELKECDFGSLDQLLAGKITIGQAKDNCCSHQYRGIVKIENDVANFATCQNKKGGLTIIDKFNSNNAFPNMDGGIALVYKAKNQDAKIAKDIESGTLILAKEDLIKKIPQVWSNTEMSSDPPQHEYGDPLILGNLREKTSYAINYRTPGHIPADQIDLMNQGKISSAPYFYYNNREQKYYFNSTSTNNQIIEVSKLEIKDSLPESLKYTKKLSIFKDSSPNINQTQRHNEFRDSVIVYQTHNPQQLTLDLEGQNNVIILEDPELLQKTDDNQNFKAIEKEAIEKIKQQITINVNYPLSSAGPDLVLIRIPDPDDPEMTTFEVLSP
jgi:hypothetical protein